MTLDKALLYLAYYILFATIGLIVVSVWRSR